MEMEYLCCLYIHFLNSYLDFQKLYEQAHMIAKQAVKT